MPLIVRLHRQPVAAAMSEASFEVLADERADQRAMAAFEAGRADSVGSGAALLEAALAELDKRAERAERELTSQAVELAVEIARSLLRVRVEAGDYDLERVVRAALADSGVGRGEVSVHLHPDDHALLEGCTFRTGTRLEIDPSMPRGDVHLSTARGLLVRDVEGSLESIREQLLEDVAS